MPQSNVFNMDCMEGMRGFPDKFFELAIVDPPYGIGVCKAAYVTANNKRVLQKSGKKLYVKKQLYGGATGIAPYQSMNISLR